MEKTRNVIVRAPVTVVIGPVPDQVDGPSELFRFGLAHMQRIFDDKGIKATFDGKQTVATFAINDEPAKSQTAAGLVLDDRVYRIQPAGEQHQLDLSTDKGVTFTAEATFADYAFARAVGDAWVEGWAEKEME